MGSGTYFAPVEALGKRSETKVFFWDTLLGKPALLKIRSFTAGCSWWKGAELGIAPGPTSSTDFSPTFFLLGPVVLPCREGRCLNLRTLSKSILFAAHVGRVGRGARQVQVTHPSQAKTNLTRAPSPCSALLCTGNHTLTLQCTSGSFTCFALSSARFTSAANKERHPRIIFVLFTDFLCLCGVGFVRSPDLNMINAESSQFIRSSYSYKFNLCYYLTNNGFFFFICYACLDLLCLYIILIIAILLKSSGQGQSLDNHC